MVKLFLVNMNSTHATCDIRTVAFLPEDFLSHGFSLRRVFDIEGTAAEVNRTIIAIGVLVFVKFLCMPAIFAAGHLILLGCFHEDPCSVSGTVACLAFRLLFRWHSR